MYSAWVPRVDTTRCLRVRGDSMERISRDGSIVAVDLEQPEPKALVKNIVAPRVKDGVTIKWLEFARDVLVFPAENGEHDTIVLYPGEGDENAVIGRVSWWSAHAP